MLCFFLVIYYLVGACKGLRRGCYWLLRLEIHDLRSRLFLLLSFYGCCLFLLVLCLRVRLGRLLILRGRIVLRVCGVLFLLRCILLALLVFSCRVPLCIHLRLGFLLWVFFRWILLFAGFCFGLVCCRLAWGFPPFGFSSIIMEKQFN
ncbi:hypothetical protein bcf_04735 [Bacillus cereus F837/76]|nr:hypothetical protein bcf_04735 [Bacillus cereus F837/76]